MIRRQKLIGIIASVLLAAVGTGLLVTYVRSAEHRAQGDEKTVSVLVVTATIPKGTKAEAATGSVKTELVPTHLGAMGAIASLTTLAGRVAAVDLLPGEQLVESRFTTAADVGKLTAPPDALQVTVALDAVRLLGGRVRSGDSVGVVASFDDPPTSRLILQKVPITDVRTDTGVPVTDKAEGTVATGRLFVTLALDAPSVERVVFAAEHGHLWLSWEPQGANEGGTALQTLAEVNL